MNDNTTVYRLTKPSEEFVGTLNDIAKEFNISETTLSSFFSRGRFHGYDVKKIGIKRKVYSLYKNDKLIKTGHLEEIANEIYVRPNRILQVVNDNLKMFKEYTVTFDGFDFEEKK